MQLKLLGAFVKYFQNNVYCNQRYWIHAVGFSFLEELDP